MKKGICKHCSGEIQQLPVSVDDKDDMAWIHTPTNNDSWTDACPRPPQTYAEPIEQPLRLSAPEFVNYCNICGRSNGTHSYHCNNDR